VQERISHPGGTAWEGDAADAALLRAAGDVAKVNSVAQQLRNAAASARMGATDLYAAKQLALGAIDQVRAAGFDVSEDLSVTSCRTGGTAFDQLLRQAHANAHSANIRAQVVALATLDQRVACAITTAAAEVGNVTFTEAPIYGVPAGRNGIQAVDFKESPSVDPPPDLSDAATGRTAADIRAATGHLPQGTRPTINLIQNEAELRRLWKWATENSMERTGSSHPGVQRVLGDGTIVSWRDAAASTSKPAIDVRYSDGSTQKFHINGAKGGTPNYSGAASSTAPRPSASPQVEAPRPESLAPRGRVPIPPAFAAAPDLVELPGADRTDPPPIDADGIDSPPQAAP
jgi:hypothetical protein